MSRSHLKFEARGIAEVKDHQTTITVYDAGTFLGDNDG